MGTLNPTHSLTHSLTITSADGGVFAFACLSVGRVTQNVVGEFRIIFAGTSSNCLDPDHGAEEYNNF